MNEPISHESSNKWELLDPYWMTLWNSMIEMFLGIFPSFKEPDSWDSMKIPASDANIYWFFARPIPLMLLFGFDPVRIAPFMDLLPLLLMLLMLLMFWGRPGGFLEGFSGFFQGFFGRFFSWNAEDGAGSIDFRLTSALLPLPNFLPAEGNRFQLDSIHFIHLEFISWNWWLHKWPKLTINDHKWPKLWPTNMY